MMLNTTPPRKYFPFFLTAVIVLLCMPLLSVADDARLPDPTYSSAVALWQAGKPIEALDALETALKAIDKKNWPAEAFVLKATLLADLKKYREAEVLWLDLAAREKPLATYALRRVVNSHIDNGDLAGAKAFLEKLIKSDGLRAHASLTLKLADSYKSAGKLSEAESLYRRILRIQRKGSYADGARLGLAGVLEAKGDLSGAIGILRQAQLYRLRAGTLAEARAAEQRIRKAAGVQVGRFTEWQYRDMARSLRKASLFKASLDVLEEWGAKYPQSKQADRIGHETIETLYRMRSNADALSRCAQFYREFPKSGLRHQVRFIELRLNVRLGKTKQVKSLADAIRKSKGIPTSIRDDAGIVLASYLVSVGEVEAGLDAYRAVYRSTSSKNRKRSILWRAGIAALRAGQNQRAATNLRALARLGPSKGTHAAALYWLSVSESRLGRWEAAVSALLGLIERYQYDYYGVRAKLLLPGIQHRITSKRFNSLAKAARLKPLTFPSLKINSRARRHERFAAAEILAKAGLTGDAAYYLRRLLNSYRSDKALAYCAIRTYAAAGENTTSVGLVATYFPSFLYRPAEGLPADFWELAYPRPYWGEIYREAERQSIDPFLMLALMRQESRFDPEARSGAGAIGLFQIMPYTADLVGPRVGLRNLDEADLTDPSVNARIAARVISDLMRRFDDYVVPVIAAYNAGEDRVEAWWKAGRNLPDDLFIDSMPYSETRNFVRLVLTNYFTYNRLYPPETAADE